MSKIINGDCLKVMSEMGENTIDAVVTDPPYGLSFMGKEWDHGIPGIPFWEETLRVCKPGAHMLAFGGTRTHHRLMVAIEDAGWEIRDCLMWVYGSGFPKSLDVSKAIDKAAGAEREVVGLGKGTGKQNPAWNGTEAGRKENSLKPEYNLTSPTTTAAIQWNGWGTALKPAWEPIILCRKPLDGTVANNVQKWGTGAINIDGCRVEYLSDMDKINATPQGNCTGRLGALAGKAQHDGERTEFKRPELKGRFPANFIHDGSNEVLRLFPETTSGIFNGHRNKPKTKDVYNGWKFTDEVGHNGDSGSAARFFYCAKATTNERNAGVTAEPQKVNDGRDTPIDNAFQRGETLRKNIHPTVKPVALLKYLCRLITPPQGTILDPFAGSGSTGISAQEEGFNYVLIEINEEYYRIAKMRNAQVTL